MLCDWIPTPIPTYFSVLCNGGRSSKFRSLMLVRSVDGRCDIDPEVLIEGGAQHHLQMQVTVDPTELLLRLVQVRRRTSEAPEARRPSA